MNIYIELLWIILIILIIIFIILNFITINKFYDSKEVVSIKQNSNCYVATNLLPNIENDKCCYKGNTITSSRFVPELNMVVNPVSIPYLNVCIEYCGYNGYDTEKKQCIDEEKQKELENCIKISKPINCVGYSMPVAILNTTYYYPNSATDINCLETTNCF